MRRSRRARITRTTRAAGSAEPSAMRAQLATARHSSSARQYSPYPLSASKVAAPWMCKAQGKRDDLRAEKLTARKIYAPGARLNQSKDGMAGFATGLPAATQASNPPVMDRTWR